MIRYLLPLLLAAAPAAGTAHAQSYPTKPIRMVVPASPGGVTDIVARAIGPHLSEVFKQSVVIDNRAGAGGIIGTDTVAKSAPDGYTLLAVFDSFISNPYVFKDVPYDTVRDFAPITLVVRGPQIVTTHPKAGFRSIPELISQARARKAPVTFATAGPATSSRLSVELFKTSAGIEPTLVHYKGGGPALTELLGGHVEVMIASAGLVLPHIKAGRLTALGVTSRQRTSLVPGVAAVSEHLPGFDVQSWVGILAPAATPPAIIQRLNQEVARAMATPDMRERMLQQGYETATGTPGEFGKWIVGESARWGKLIRAQGITAD